MQNEKLELLVPQLEIRKRNVVLYQTNIDNFKLAIKEAENYDGMEEFVEELKKRIKDETYQQNKEKIMLAVIEKQLEGIDITPYLEQANDQTAHQG